MIIRRKPQDSKDALMERQIVIGMIANTSFLTQVLDIYKSEYILSPHLRIISEWCEQYFKKYKRAPEKHIQDLFLIYEQESPDQDQVALIRKMLSDLSNDYEKAENFNVEHVLDNAEIHFKKSSLELLKRQLSNDLLQDNVIEAESAVANFSRVARTGSIGIDPITNPATIRRILENNDADKMFSLPGDLKKMFDYFERDMFVMIVAPMGRGKTWWLQEIALRGLFSGFNVLFVSLEMSERQMARRILHNITGLPKKRWAGKISIPVFDCEFRQNKECDDRERKGPCTKCRGTDDFNPAVYHIMKNKKKLTAERAIEKGLALKETFLRGNRFKLISPPPNSINISKLRIMLDNWEYYEGWSPDIIVTDYADKFAPEKNSSKEYRHKIYETVISHKSLAMERHCLVLSASQSNTGRDDSRVVRSGDFAEDIRKRAEVDIAFSLNQTPEEKEKGWMRISPMKIRDDDFNVTQQCIVLQQLKIGKPYLDSYLLTKGDSR